MEELTQRHVKYVLKLPHMCVSKDSVEHVVRHFTRDNGISLEDKANIELSFRDVEEYIDLYIDLLGHFLAYYRNANVYLTGHTKHQSELFYKSYSRTREWYSKSMTKDQLIESMKDYPGDTEIVISTPRTKDNEFSMIWKEKGQAHVFAISDDPNIIILET